MTTIHTLTLARRIEMLNLAIMVRMDVRREFIAQL